MSDNELQSEWASRAVRAVQEGRIDRRTFLRRGSVIGLSLGSLGTLLAACGDDDDGATGGGGTSETSETTAGGQSTSGGIIRIGSIPPNTALEPVTMFDAQIIAVTQQVLEYLAWTENDGSLRPVLATEWAPEDEGARWLFTLREGVTFNDGTPLTAEQVVATFDRLTDPDVETAAAAAFESVLSAGGIEQVGDFEVAFNLDRAFSDFPYLVSSTNYNSLILPTEYDMDFETNPVGTGPFLLTDYTSGQSATLERNPDYWQEGLPLLEGVEFTFFEDGPAQVLALQGGDLDTQVATQRSIAGPLEEDEDFEIATTPSSAMVAINLRVDTEPFTSPEARQAFALAVNRADLIETLYLGDAALGNDHLFAPSFPIRPEGLEQREQDIAAAQGLLEEAGFADGLEFTATFDDASADYATLLQQQLEEAGMTMNLEQLDPADFYAAGDDTPWLSAPVTLVGWAARAVPSQFVIPMMRTDGIWNSAKYSNPEFDSLAEEYDATIDEADRADLAEQMAEIMQTDSPVIIPLWISTARAIRTTVGGFDVSASSFVDLTNATIEE